MPNQVSIHIPSEEGPDEDVTEEISSKFIDIEDTSFNLIDKNLRLSEDADKDIIDTVIDDEETNQVDQVCRMTPEPYMEVLTLSLSIAENVGAAAVSTYIYEKLSERNISVIRDSHGDEVEVDKDELKSIIENTVCQKGE